MSKINKLLQQTFIELYEAQGWTPIQIADQLEQISMFQTAKSPFLVYSKPYSYVVRVNGLKEKENLKILLTRKSTSFTFLLDEYDGVEYIMLLL